MAETSGICVIRAWRQDDGVGISLRIDPDTEDGSSPPHQAMFNDPAAALNAVAEFLDAFIV